MTAHDAIAAVPVAGTPNRSALQALLVDRLVYFVGAAEDPTALDPTAGGSIVKVLAFNGRLFWYDSADGSTAHDGTTCIVTAGGERYKVEAVNWLIRSVLDKDLTAPPGGESLGDAYIVGTAATGDWATHDDDIAVYTARGWEFVTPGAGWLVYAEDEELHYKFTAAGAWALALSPATSSILASMINGGRTHWVVENQTTNTPPSAAQGTAYIVGPSGTGDWTGQAGKIAVRETAGTSDEYVLYTPGEGWKAFDKALNIDVNYDGAAWVSASGAMIDIVKKFTATGSTGAGGSGLYTYSSTTAPTTTPVYIEDQVTHTFTAKAAGTARLEITYRARAFHASNGMSNLIAAVFRDSETSAAAWALLGRPDSNPSGVILDVRFDALIDVADTNSHTYKIRVIASYASQIPSALDRRLFMIKEFAV